MIDFKSNYFQIFGLPVSFNIDQSVLKKAYLDIQKNIHPDKFVGETQTSQRLAIQASAFVNSAFETLKSDLSRAEYLLELNQVDIQSETDTKMDPAFLMLQMHWREQLESEALPVLDELFDEVTGFCKTSIGDLDQAFNQQNYSAARELVRKLQFIEKVKEELNNKLTMLD